MFKSWYPSNTGCDWNCLILIVEREHSSSHQKPILAPVGYVQKLIPVEKLVVTENGLILIVEREHSSFHQWGMAIQQSPTTAFIHVGTEVAGYRRQQLSSSISQLQCCEHNNIWHSFKNRINRAFRTLFCHAHRTQ